MTNYRVNVLDLNGAHRFSLDLKVKHFRQYQGRNVLPHGGHTCIFDMDSGLVFSSKCRGNEQFSRRYGVLTFLQKMLQCKAFHCAVPKDSYWIADATFTKNGCDVYISDGVQTPYYWLENKKISLVSEE